MDGTGATATYLTTSSTLLRPRLEKLADSRAMLPVIPVCHRVVVELLACTTRSFGLGSARRIATGRTCSRRCLRAVLIRVVFRLQLFELVDRLVEVRDENVAASAVRARDVDIDWRGRSAPRDWRKARRPTRRRQDGAHGRRVQPVVLLALCEVERWDDVVAPTVAADAQQKIGIGVLDFVLAAELHERCGESG